MLQFNHALFVNYAAAMADTKQVGLDTVITYDANDSVTLTGVAASHLTASNFKHVAAGHASTVPQTILNALLKHVLGRPINLGRRQ